MNALRYRFPRPTLSSLSRPSELSKFQTKLRHQRQQGNCQREARIARPPPRTESRRLLPGPGVCPPANLAALLATMLSKLASHLAPATPAPTPAAAAAAGPLDGITVIDAGQAITGPLAASMLGDMGAEVIKVESPHGMGDLNRPVGPMRGGEGIYMHNFVRRLQAVAHPSPR